MEAIQQKKLQIFIINLLSFNICVGKGPEINSLVQYSLQTKQWSVLFIALLSITNSIISTSYVNCIYLNKNAIRCFLLVSWVLFIPDIYELVTLVWSPFAYAGYQGDLVLQLGAAVTTVCDQFSNGHILLLCTVHWSAAGQNLAYMNEVPISGCIYKKVFASFYSLFFYQSPISSNLITCFIFCLLLCKSRRNKKNE